MKRTVLLFAFLFCRNMLVQSPIIFDTPKNFFDKEVISCFIKQYDEYVKECYADSTNLGKGFWFIKPEHGDRVARQDEENTKKSWWREWDSMGEDLEEHYKTKAKDRWVHNHQPDLPGFIDFLKRKANL